MTDIEALSTAKGMLSYLLRAIEAIEEIGHIDQAVAQAKKRLEVAKREHADFDSERTAILLVAHDEAKEMHDAAIRAIENKRLAAEASIKAERDHAQAELETIKTQRDRLDSEIASLQGQMHEFQEEVENGRQQLAKLNDAIAEGKALHVEVKSKLAELKKAI